MYNSVFIFILIGTSLSPIKGNLTPKERLDSLRKLMENEGYSACIIPQADQHLSEYVSDYDKRRGWLSGFTGSAGTALVTSDFAAVWTDSRYYLQAEDQLDPSLWKLMKASDENTPTIQGWLRDNLESGDKVAVNAKFSSVNTWQNYEKVLSGSGILLESPSNDLIDQIWPKSERPNQPNNFETFEALDQHKRAKNAFKFNCAFKNFTFPMKKKSFPYSIKLNHFKNGHIKYVFVRLVFDCNDNSYRDEMLQ
ncbi:peptidase M24 [Brachionus plicatilis]|uniref:Peptidase M24 n=1 Tax=Brachionus plicatilis TaxID=10195 RepID=A0A3M7RC55_BRAPC|nr:peptidase M24 [Brachionus plicatilis]